jgi:hypothetical protein
VKTTRYFDESVMVRRPYLKQEWLVDVVANPLRVEVQPNGRIRYWAFVTELGKYLRVITEPDGETVHNAFPDRGFRPPPESET